MTDSALSGPAAPGPRLGGAGRWTGSLALVLAAHVAGGAALLTWRQPPGDEAVPPPAVMIDLTPLPEPAPAPPPPAPEPQPEPQPQPAPPPEPPPPEPPPPEPIPIPEPPPPEPIIEPPPVEAPPALVPDAMVAVPVPVAKPKPPKPPPVHKVEPPHRPPPDTVAKPAPTPPAQPPAAPTPARTAAAVPPGVVRSWQGEVLARLERYKRYPRAAQARRQEGTARVRFTIDRQGRLVSASLERSSGVPALDEEAVALLSRAAPLPTPPADMDADDLTLIVPIAFAIR